MLRFLATHFRILPGGGLFAYGQHGAAGPSLEGVADSGIRVQTSQAGRGAQPALHSRNCTDSLRFLTFNPSTDGVLKLA